MLSNLAKSIWGKLSHDGSHKWLPLWMHLDDSAEITKLLWDYWLPEHTKRIITNGIDEPDLSCDKLKYAKKIAIFMAAIHDVGKATPSFVIKGIKAGYRDVIDEIISNGLEVSFAGKAVPHAIIGQEILQLQGLDSSYAVIIGGHHGKPPNNYNEVNSLVDFPKMTGIKNDKWDIVQKELITFALDKAGLTNIPQGKLSIPAQVLLTGIIIMSDWIASGDNFPLISRDYRQFVESGEKRAYKAWRELDLPEFGDFSHDCDWQKLYLERFDIVIPRPMQTDALQTAVQTKQPGIFVIEAPMGEGKTEAALAVAEVVAKEYKMSGVYFALPTQATSDGIFKRFEKWIRQLQNDSDRTIFLAHGKAGFNPDYEGIKLNSNVYNYDDNRKETVIVNDWTQGRKKGLLSDFVVGTIDQILMCGLKQKHLALRHLGIANKVVIIDECHAYDTYMSSYLYLVLSWLAAYNVPVIILSATLPLSRRKELIAAYQKSKPKQQKKISGLAALRKNRGQLKEVIVENDDNINAYPLISYTDGNVIREIASTGSGRKLSVEIKFINETSLIKKLNTLLSDGGCAAVYCNTVIKAQKTAKLLEQYFGAENIQLLHSKFISSDRVKKEEDVRSKLGPDNAKIKRPQKLIVVGTQVMEQSLDIDFDLMFTDICPMDLLIQRLGRLFRHKREFRPDKLLTATCYVISDEDSIDFDAGSIAVYGEYLLLKTRALLPSVIKMPEDIPQLVRQSYEKGYDEAIINRLSKLASINSVQKRYKMAKNEYEKNIHDKETKAQDFQIKMPDNQVHDLVGWLQADIKDRNGKRGEATVRDTQDSIEVLVIKQKTNGDLYTLPWLQKDGDKIIRDVPNDKLAKVIAGCSVSLPVYFTQKWNIDNTITELEELILKYNLDILYESYWLAGELFIVLDENYEMKLLDKYIVYDEKYGLSIKEKE